MLGCCIKKAEGILGGPGAPLDLWWARYESLSKACVWRAKESGNHSIAYHMNTIPVVRGIIEIAERHGEWREREARELCSNSKTADDSQERTVLWSDEMLARVTWKRDKELVNFWGISYGTFLGASLATTYPDRKGRVLLDSVVESSSWQNRTWFSLLTDSDKLLTAFCVYCFRVGPGICPFYRDPPEEIRDAFDNVMGQLWENPVSVATTNTRGPDFVAYADV